MAYNATDQAEALTALRKMRIKPGETVYTIVRHVAPSGMSRVIDCYIMRKNKPVWIGWHMARILDYPLHREYQGMKVPGCGMDMCFKVVYDLASVLWHKSGRSYGTKNGEPNKDPGYFLNKADL